MSLFVRADRPPPARRDISGYPWVRGDTVPTSVQDYAMAEGGAAKLRVNAVVACVGLRSGAVAQLPLRGYETVRGVDQIVDPQPALYADPGGGVVVPSVWKIQMSISRDCWGYALGRVSAWDAAMYPLRVDWIDPGVVQPRALPGNEIEWRIGGQITDPSLLVHVPSRWVLPGQPWGVSPLEYSGLVELARYAQNFGRDWFRNGAVPSAIVYSDDPKLTSTQSENMVDRLVERWRARRPAVLSKNFRYEKVSVAADESQFLQTCTKISADIAAAFNLPPSRIGAAISGQSVTYQNLDQSQQQLLVDSINPDLVVVEESLDQHTPPTIFARFDTERFTRSDTKTQYEIGEIGVRARLVLPNEWRNRQGLPPLPGGDSFPVTPQREQKSEYHMHAAPVTVEPANVTMHGSPVTVEPRQAPVQLLVEGASPPRVTSRVFERDDRGRVAAIVSTFENGHEVRQVVTRDERGQIVGSVESEVPG